MSIYIRMTTPFIYFWFSRTDTDTEINFTILLITDAPSYLGRLQAHTDFFLFDFILGRNTPTSPHNFLFLFSFWAELTKPTWLICFLTLRSMSPKQKPNPLPSKYIHTITLVPPQLNKKHATSLWLCSMYVRSIKPKTPSRPRSRLTIEYSYYTPSNLNRVLPHGSSVSMFPNKFTTCAQILIL